MQDDILYLDWICLTFNNYTNSSCHNGTDR